MQTYIRTSDNAIKGKSQMKNKSWDDAAFAFNQLKKHIDDFDTHLKKKKKYN